MYAKFIAMSAFMILFKASGIEVQVETARWMYGSSISVLSLLWTWVFTIISKRDQQEKVTYTEKDPVTLKDVKKVSSIKDYDIAELKKLVLTTTTGIAFVILFHIYKGFVTPLVLQALLLIVNFVDSKLFKIHVMNYPAVGTLKRPFKEDNPMAKAFEQMRMAETQKAEKQAKKAAKRK